MSTSKRDAKYLIDAIHVANGKVDKVSLGDQDEKDYMRRHRAAPIAEIVDLLKAGKTVVTVWYDHNLPADLEGNGCLGTIPLQVVTLPDGSESIDVVKRGQTESYQSILNLPIFDQHWNTPGYAEKFGATKPFN
ncbi:hypothetical protein [Polaromonas sp.]|uniref:hypothetical protein n=1 Tax=Polaromonas sp. TaxID=1869339 RepID=UPI00272F42B1|nr:hypothetical protein [Polaromonas sp.]MDP1888262.1 hypothetical protein [Polaromonas sp.]MDP3223564.1 hypothetical protein [Rubrivivax sp.]